MRPWSFAVVVRQICALAQTIRCKSQATTTKLSSLLQLRSDIICCLLKYKLGQPVSAVTVLCRWQSTCATSRTGHASHQNKRSLRTWLAPAKVFRAFKISCSVANGTPGLDHRSGPPPGMPMHCGVQTATVPALCQEAQNSPPSF